MRLVFWLFLVLNLAFFYWHYSQPREAEPALLPTEAVPPGVERLVLLRERGLDPLSQVQPPPASPPPEKTEPAPPVAGIAPAREAATPGPAVPDTAMPPQPETTTPPQPEAAMPVQPETVPESTPEHEAETTPESEAVPVAEPEPPPVVMACFTLGPLKDESEAGLMYKALRALGITAEQRLSERRELKGYWVYLPPLKSYADARRKVQVLTEKGLDDMYIMGKGEMKNAISLGIFSRKSTATERFNQVRRIDPATMMKPRYRTTRERWLDIRVDSAQTETIARIAALAEAQPGVGLEQRKACK